MKQQMALIAVGALVAVMLMGVGVVSAGDIETDGKVVSTASSGPPLAVSSTVMVDNLNADQLDGLEGSDLYIKAEVDALIAGLHPALLVVDSTGVTVGPVIEFLPDAQGMPNSPLVVFRYEGKPILLKADENSLVAMARLRDNHTSIRLVHYELPGCSGDAYISWVGSDRTKADDMIGEYYAVGVDNFLFRPTGVQPPEGSVRQSSSTGPGQCGDNPLEFVDQMHFAESVVDLDDFFTPPYHIE